MKCSEIRNFNYQLENICVEPDFLQEYSKGMEWSDVPFPNLKSIEHKTYSSCMDSMSIIKRNPSVKYVNAKVIFHVTPEKDLNWKELLVLYDELIGLSGATSVYFFEGFDRQNDSLTMILGS